ncbi:MAG: hypothetical protein ACI4U2_07260 [Christensenellaceae bacterium]
MAETSEKTYICGDPTCAYKITYYRNENGACSKEEASCAIVHRFDRNDTLVECRYETLFPAGKRTPVKSGDSE